MSAWNYIRCRWVIYTLWCGYVQSFLERFFVVKEERSVVHEDVVSASRSGSESSRIWAKGKCFIVVRRQSHNFGRGSRGGFSAKNEQRSTSL